MAATTFLRTGSGFRVIYPHGAARTIPDSKIDMILSELGIVGAEAQAKILQLTPGQSTTHHQVNAE